MMAVPVSSGVYFAYTYNVKNYPHFKALAQEPGILSGIYETCNNLATFQGTELLQRGNFFRSVPKMKKKKR